MRGVPFLVAASLTAVSAAIVAAEDTPPAVPAKPGPPPEGLLLEARVAGRATIQPGESPEVALFLRNRSKDRTIPVVLPGDGSESGWREPHVHWTATQVLPDGTERPIEPQPLFRCGMFDPDWQKDVVKLAAGESRELRDWMPSLATMFDFQEKGRVRLTAHYVYRAGAAAKGNPIAEAAPSKGTGAMGDTPAFEMTATPVEITVERPLDVVASVKGKVRAGRAFALADVLSARVVNRDGRAVVLRPAEWSVSFEIDPRALPPQYEDVKDLAADPAEIALAADASADVYGPAARFPRQVARVTFAKAGTARVAVRLVAAGTGPRIRSAWVDLVVEE